MGGGHCGQDSGQTILNEQFRAPVDQFLLVGKIFFKLEIVCYETKRTGYWGGENQYLIRFKHLVET